MTDRSPDTRIQHDSLGDVALPIDALWGPQTQRAVENFPLHGQRRLGDFPLLVNALVAVKQAAAIANRDGAYLDEAVADAIVKAGDAVRAGGHYDHFPVHHLHGGGGTSANMNTNEVLANLAIVDQSRVDPLRDVNLHQSTNDVVPTAGRIAALWAWQTCRPALEDLELALNQAVEEFGGVPRLARTCLQDAAASTYADLLGGYRTVVSRSSNRIEESVGENRTISLGGTLVGRSQDAPAGYRLAVVVALGEVTGIDGLQSAADLTDGAQNPDPLVAVSTAIDIAARSLLKIAKDLRLLSSGPEGGLGELTLQALQPGSSALPAKVNPVLPEHAVQLAMKISGLHTMATAALEHGELDLNVWEMPMTAAVLEELELLASASAALAATIRGATPDLRRNEAHAGVTFALLHEVASRHGYEAAAEITESSRGDLSAMRAEILRRHPDISSERS